MLSRLIYKIVSQCFKRRAYVLIVFAVSVMVALVISWQKLGVSTDTSQMFSDQLAWKQRSDQFGREFPQNENQLVAVVESDIPEQAVQSARLLADELKQDNFKFVTVPTDNSFLNQNGLLFLPTQKLEELLNKIVIMQPFLGTLAANPSVNGLNQGLAMIALGISRGQTLENFSPALNSFADVIEAQARGDSSATLSWQNLLGDGLTDLAGRYQFVLAKHELNYGSLKPGEKAVGAMRRAIQSLPLVRSGKVHVHLTGDVLISDEEFSTVADGMIIGLVVSLILVTLWLFLAVKTWRLVIPILITLVSGLVLTTGVAALAVRTLNLISVAFAILFVGIAVDFLIQFCVRFRNQTAVAGKRPPLSQALASAGGQAGPQIAVAASATAVGFLAFTLTSFVGVAQLGFIAGAGMIIAFICTLTLLPALVGIFNPSVIYSNKKSIVPSWMDHTIRVWRRPVLAIFALIAIGGLLIIPRLNFDADPFHIKDPNSEGMKGLSLLMGDPRTTPYSVSALVKNGDIAQEIVKKLGKMDDVHDVMWLGSLVPDDQETKLAMIADAGNIILPTLSLGMPLPIPDVGQIRSSIQETAVKLNAVTDDFPYDSAIKRIAKALVTLQSASDDKLVALNSAITQYLPEQLAKLRIMLSAAKPITIESIPKDLASNYILPDGRMKIDIHPNGVGTPEFSMVQFVGKVRTIIPDVVGVIVDIVESAQTIIHAFIIAAILSFLTISFILFLVLRRITDVMLVLVPLALSAIVTLMLVVLVDQPLNFANVIALPLLLGVGVSFNIYFVMNWRMGLSNPLSSPTARAVLFSALTTATAFGSLAASHHPGTASMGDVLLLSLVATLTVTMVFLPAFLPKRPQDPY